MIPTLLQYHDLLEKYAQIHKSRPHPLTDLLLSPPCLSLQSLSPPALPGQTFSTCFPPQLASMTTPPVPSHFLTPGLHLSPHHLVLKPDSNHVPTHTHARIPPPQLYLQYPHILPALLSPPPSL